MIDAGIFNHAVLFTGHMIDAQGRKEERFPPRAEGAARLAIQGSIEALLAKEQRLVGIAGGANGGDLLFHEVCGDLGVPTLLRLALPVKEFVEASVAPAGEGWVRRFYKLVGLIRPDAIRVLDEAVTLPKGLTSGAELNVWQRANLWMVEETIAIAPQRTLIALWDGEAGDGPGGTAHLVEAAPGLGIDVEIVIRTQALIAAP